MTLVNVFHLPVTPFKNRNAAKHGTLVTVDHVKTAPNIIIPWIKRSRARAAIRTYFHPTHKRTHDFTPYSALNLAFSAYASRSDVITATNHRSRCSRCSRTTRMNHEHVRASTSPSPSLSDRVASDAWPSLPVSNEQLRGANCKNMIGSWTPSLHQSNTFNR